MRFEVIITEKSSHRYVVDARTGQEAVMKAATARASGTEPESSAVLDTNVSKPKKLADEDQPTLEGAGTAKS